jgi:hypothetical protein
MISLEDRNIYIPAGNVTAIPGCSLYCLVPMLTEKYISLFE